MPRQYITYLNKVRLVSSVGWRTIMVGHSVEAHYERCIDQHAHGQPMAETASSEDEDGTEEGQSQEVTVTSTHNKRMRMGTTR